MTTITEKQYIENALTKISISSLRRLLAISIILFCFFGLVNYYLDVEHAKKFISLRISVLVLFIIIIAITPSLPKYTNSLIIISILIGSSVIEIISITYTPHTFAHYQAQILVVIVTHGFFPLSKKTSLVIIMLISLIFFIPLMLIHPDYILANYSEFLLLSSYFFSTCIVAHIWRKNSQEDLVWRIKKQYEQEIEITKQKTELSNISKTLQSLIDNASDGILFLDTKGNILDMNLKAIIAYGQKPIRDNLKTLDPAVYDKIFSPEFMEQMLQGKTVLFDIYIQTNDTRKYFEVSANITSTEEKNIVQMFYRDITERKKANEQMLQTQKIKTAALCAAGIAHDIKNLLFTIQSFIDLIEIKYNDIQTARHIAPIQEKINRTKDMIHKMLQFGKQEALTLRPYSINELISSLVDTFINILPQNISIKTHLSSRQMYALIDKTAIEQSLLNLIINAKDAMPEGGVISISSGIKTETGHHNYFEGKATDKYIKITISDTGTGILENQIPHIFEPFYTTKENNKSTGSGLGLSMVLKTIEEHKGYISVKSKIGKGSTFAIFLPMLPQSTDPPSKKATDLQIYN